MKTRAVCVPLLALGLAGLLAAPPARGANEYLRLDGPEGQVREFGEICPARVELPLTLLFRRAERGKLKTNRASGVTCRGAYLKTLTLERGPGRWVQRTKSVSGSLGSHIVITPEIFVGEGVDTILNIDYELVQGDQEIATGHQAIDAAALRRYCRPDPPRLFEPRIAGVIRHADDFNPVEAIGLSFDPKAITGDPKEMALRITLSLER